MTSNTAGQLDEVIDPRLAAIRDVYNLMIAARREPGEVKTMSVEARFAADVCERARHEGFNVSETPCPIHTGRRAISVRWPGRSL